MCRCEYFLDPCWIHPTRETSELLRMGQSLAVCELYHLSTSSLYYHSQVNLFCMNCEIVRGSCRAAQVPVKCHFGGLKPALRL
jgi:hypothetical protein